LNIIWLKTKKETQKTKAKQMITVTLLNSRTKIDGSYKKEQTKTERVLKIK